MADLVNYAFISRLEGGSRTTGYVPAPKISNSGVTIATGFDLGARVEQDLRTLALPAPLITRLRPYLGKKKQAAELVLQQLPLQVTASEATMIDRATHRANVTALRSAYWLAPKNVDQTDFFDLPGQAQTVTASVAFQYGNLQHRAPTFWNAVTAQDWHAAVRTLLDFGDSYMRRRMTEADLLVELVK